MYTTRKKKQLYKEKPNAIFRYIRKGIAYYYADLKNERVEFAIPVDDMGTADFTATMDAKLLNRWILMIKED